MDLPEQVRGMFYKCYESVGGLIDEWRPPEPGLMLALDEVAEVVLEMLSRENWYAIAAPPPPLPLPVAIRKRDSPKRKPAPRPLGPGPAQHSSASASAWLASWLAGKWIHQHGLYGFQTNDFSFVIQ